MGELLARSKYKREAGYLYYVKDDENGNLCIYKAKLERAGRKKVIKK